MLLYRPVGLEELALIFQAAMKAFPPRLPEQPIFYPVLNAEYAAQIARDWNTKSDSLAGYVTRFRVEDAYAASLPVRTVGARQHQELWIAAEELPAMNARIDGRIEVIEAFFGEGFRGHVPTGFSLRGKDAVGQFVTLCGLFAYSLMDFHGEVAANALAVFLHAPFWQQRSFASEGIDETQRDAVLAGIRKAWAEVNPEIALM